MNWIRERYFETEELRLERGGLFEALWRRHEGLVPSGPELAPVAYWDEPRPGQRYYRLRHELTGEAPREALLVLFLDPWLVPPYVIEDYLRAVPPAPVPWRCVLQYGDFSLRDHGEYVHRVYGILREYLPRHAEFLEPAALVKRLSYRGVQFFAPGLEWVFGDPWIAHLLLARGAERIGSATGPELTVAKTVRLSEFHALEIGELAGAGQRFDVDVVRRMYPEKRDGRSSTNSLGVPDSFLSLSYRNLLR
jgi:hypothetical protein